MANFVLLCFSISIISSIAGRILFIHTIIPSEVSDLPTGYKTILKEEEEHLKEFNKKQEQEKYSQNIFFLLVK